MPIDSPFDVYHVRCPHCGHAFDYAPPLPATQELSPLALAILAYNDTNCDLWRRGKPVSLRTWAIRVYADPRLVRAAMRELVAAGFAATIPYGQKGRVQYVGVPSMLQRFALLAA